MNLHQEHQQARFSAAAAGYNRLARVQRAVADRLFQGLAFLGDAHRVLDIGCGTGNLTRRLAETWPRADVDGIDLAPGMIDEARRLNGTATRPVFFVADAATFTGERPYDLLVSSSTLHWVQPLESTFKHLANLLTSDGGFAFAIMLEHTLKELHDARTEVAPDNPPAQRMPSNEAVCDALARAGFHVEIDEMEEHVTHAESTAELLHELQALGVTGGPLSRGTRPLSRGEIQRLAGIYDTRYRDEAGVFATYQVGHYWGWRNA